jgi:hypothetical protein
VRGIGGAEKIGIGGQRHRGGSLLA